MKGVLVALSGPSGSGKGTILQMLLSQREDTVCSISATTRSPRPGEEEGVHYYFKSRHEFERMIATNALLEYAEYNGNYYGTPRVPIEKWLNAGKNVLLEIEVQGAEQVIDSGVPMASVFITVPSAEELERRLRGRGTESEESIQGRLRIARWELSRAFRYDYVVLNDTVEDAVGRLHSILNAEGMRYCRMGTLVEDIL